MANQAPLHRRAWLLGLLLLVLVPAALVMWRRPHQPPAPAADAAPTDSFAPTPAQWAGLRIAKVSEVAFHRRTHTDGLVVPDDDLSTSVYSPYSGVVTALFAEPGQHVEKGAPLFAVVASEFVQAQNDLAAAVAGLATARAQQHLAVIAERRAHDLFLAQGGALKDWQQAQVDLATAEGAQASAIAALEAVRGRLRILGRTPAQIAAMQAPGAAGEAASVVAAPISGTVITRQLGPGQNIVSASAGGTSALFTIADLSQMWMLANLREEDAGRVHLGDHMRLRALALPGREFDATINYIGSAIDPTLRRLPVRATIANPDGVLKPQMFATITIIGPDTGTHLAVPEQAVVYEGEAAHVWRADPATHRLSLRAITYGALQDGLLEVRSGLDAGDSVVTSGAVFIDRAVDPN